MGKLFMLLGVLAVVGTRESGNVHAAAHNPTAFGYQGQLTEAGQPANGLFDLQVTLWDAASAGTQVAGPVTNLATQVQSGLFTTTFDFGVFPTPGSHWLGIAVRRSGSTQPFTPLTPRQPILGVPFAGHASAATEAAIAHTLHPAPATPGLPAVAIAHDSTPFPGGVTWYDPAGNVAAGLVANTTGRMNFYLSKPLYYSGAPVVVSSGSGARPPIGTNILQVLGNAQIVGNLKASGGIEFADGSRLDSAITGLQPNVLWVSTLGDDKTAVRGNPYRPFRNIGIAVSNALSGDAIMILPGRYTVHTTPELGSVRIGAPIRAVSLTNVTIAGFGGTPEIYAPDFGDIIQVASCYNLTFRNLHLRSDASFLAAPPHGQSAGICFRPDAPANARILIDNCRFTGVPHAITTFAAPAVTCDHLTVRDCVFVDCGWTNGVPTLGQDGGALTGFGNNLRFVNNTLDGAIRGIEFYRFPGDPGHTNAIISGNIFLNYWDCAICSFDDGPELMATLDSVVIADNLFEDAPNEAPGGEHSGSAAILINSGRRITIRGNLIKRGKLYGIKVSALTGPLDFVDITANAVSDVAGRGIQVSDYGPGIQQVRVANNRVWGNSGGGILAQGRYLDICFNDISDNYPYGIRVAESQVGTPTTDSRVYGNSLIGNTTSIVTEGVSNIVIDANHVIDPSLPGASPARASANPAAQKPNPRKPLAPSTSNRRADAIATWMSTASR